MAERRHLGVVRTRLEMASVEQEARVWVEGEGDQAVVCVRVLRSRTVRRFSLKETVGTLVRQEIAAAAATAPASRRRLAKRGKL